MALRWLGGKADHPMADARQAREIIEALPAADPFKALEEISYWLETLALAEGLKLGRRFESVDLLDSAAKNPARRLSQDYIATARQSKFQENRVWTAVFRLWRQLGEAYLSCVRDYEAGAGGATLVRKSLPVIVARALRAHALQLKWMLLRYGPIEARLWRELGHLYQAAEARGFASQPVQIYRGAHGETTAEREFLRAMMLAASCAEALAPERQEIAERAIAHFSGSFRIACSAEGCTHCFDLAAARPPVRLFKGAEPGATLRFFGAGAALAELERLAAQVAASGMVPEEAALGAGFEPDAVVGTLRHVAQHWSATPPARGSERRAATACVTVVPGFAGILGTLEPAGEDVLDFSGERAAESWLVENVSEGGYGAVIPSLRSDWIKVGALVGLQSEADRYWGVGVIRRIVRDDANRRHVGIQLVSRTAIPVRLARAGASSSFSLNRAQQSAILLSTARDRRGEIALLLREGVFNPRDSFEMTVRDRTYLLIPSRLVEGGEEYDWAKFKVMQRSA